ncbi:MAG TPA: DinB family protein [Gemmatimonadales bacterium]|nr:DinB family protein [Gemmatimonadales bacterium]
MTPELQAMLDQLDAIKRDGAAVASGLSAAAFNWHPGKGRWSIADCLQHLNVGVSKTLPAFDEAIARGRAKAQYASGPFKYGWFSRMVAGSMEPPPKFRMKTVAMLKVPSTATYRAAELLPEFARVRDQLAARVRQADGLDLARVRTISPVNRLLRLPLGAYFQFIIAHDRRHLWQARQVRNDPRFGTA